MPKRKRMTYAESRVDFCNGGRLFSCWWSIDGDPGGLILCRSCNQVPLALSTKIAAYIITRTKLR